MMGKAISPDVRSYPVLQILFIAEQKYLIFNIIRNVNISYQEIYILIRV